MNGVAGTGPQPHRHHQQEPARLDDRLAARPYSPGQITYDLRRLRLTGLTRRIDDTNRYVLTPDGIKVAVCYTKLHNRLLRPLLAADQPQAQAGRNHLRFLLRLQERLLTARE